MQYDTAGKPMTFYDMCAFCNMGTGGSHQQACPCQQAPVKTKEQLLAEISEHSHIKYGIAWQYLADH